MTQVTNNNKAKMDGAYRELVVDNMGILVQIRAYLGSNDIGFEAFASYAMEVAQGFSLLYAGREFMFGDNNDLRRIRNNALLSKREAYVRFMELQYKIDADETDVKVDQKIESGQIEALARFYYYNNRAESAKDVLAERSAKAIEIPTPILESPTADETIVEMLVEPTETLTEPVVTKPKRKRNTK